MASKGPKAPSYTTEISQMLYVFGEVKNPDEATVRFIEEVVRCQIAELLVQARTLAQRRGSRMPSTEDLIFLIRHDRGKVNRLKLYLGWKDVRKKAKEDGGDEKDIDAFEEQGTDTKLPSQKLRLRIPWDVASIYGDVLPEEEDDDDVDENDREAYEASKKLLKEADELTSKMSKEEYQYYSDCRQASFTYRKAKRFREFVGLANYLEGTPKDEVLDVLGFLACEMVRSLCERGLAVKDGYEAAKAAAKEDLSTRSDAGGPSGTKRQREEGESPDKTGSNAGSSEKKKKKKPSDEDESDEEDDGSAAFRRPPPVGLFTAPARMVTLSSSSSAANTPGRPPIDADPSASTADAAAPSTTTEPANGTTTTEQKTPQRKTPPPERTPLSVMDVEDAYSGMQLGRAKLRISGMRNFSGGLVRTKVNVI